MITKVVFTKFAEKQLKITPKYIKEALYIWTFTVEKIGIAETRKLKSYHDEPLKGKRIGQRSIRLNRSYRAIYDEDIVGALILISILEVNKHDY